MSSNKSLHELDYDNEVKGCDISKPYDALKSNFAQKLFKHLSKGTKFQEWYFEGIIESLNDEELELSEGQRDDFFRLIDEYQETFDHIVKRYK